MDRITIVRFLENELKNNPKTVEGSETMIAVLMSNLAELAGVTLGIVACMKAISRAGRRGAKTPLSALDEQETWCDAYDETWKGARWDD